MTLRFRTLFSTAAAATLMAGAAWAADPAPAAPASWMSTVKLSGLVEAGATMNGDSPSTGVNFGHLFTDKPNQVLLNQVAVTLSRDADAKTKTVDFGFKLQGMFGSDSRYTHFLGEGGVTSQRNQFDLVEANITAHVNALTPGGIDIKAGQFSTPLGNEVIAASGNFFYSKSYIFNFGIPLKHTGVLIATHVNPMLDIYTGYTSGVNTSYGADGGYNSGQFHFLGGIGLNLDKLTILALTHIGPENPAGSLPGNIHSYNRYLNDIVATYKFNDKLTSVTELNYIKDDGFDATGGGVAEYLTYTLTPTLSAGLRGEIWRDNNGFYVAGFPGNSDFVNLELGKANSAFGVGAVTYTAWTFGLNIKPAHLPKMIDGLTLRPELRYDRSIAGPAPFAQGKGGPNKYEQFTVGMDIVMPLNF